MQALNVVGLGSIPITACYPALLGTTPSAEQGTALEFEPSIPQKTKAKKRREIVQSLKVLLLYAMDLDWIPVPYMTPRAPAEVIPECKAKN